jgi:hypothetical protein
MYIGIQDNMDHKTFFAFSLYFQQQLLRTKTAVAYLSS